MQVSPLASFYSRVVPIKGKSEKVKAPKAKFKGKIKVEKLATKKGKAADKAKVILSADAGIMKDSTSAGKTVKYTYFKKGRDLRLEKKITLLVQNFFTCKSRDTFKKSDLNLLSADAIAIKIEISHTEVQGIKEDLLNYFNSYNDIKMLDSGLSINGVEYSWDHLLNKKLKEIFTDYNEKVVDGLIILRDDHNPQEDFKFLIKHLLEEDFKC